jgi:hypothetical protein
MKDFTNSVRTSAPSNRSELEFFFLVGSKRLIKCEYGSLNRIWRDAAADAGGDSGLGRDAVPA